MFLWSFCRHLLPKCFRCRLENQLVSDCYHGDWAAALKRVRHYPSEAEYSHRHLKKSALYCAICGNAPHELIRELAAACPEEISRLGCPVAHFVNTPLQIFIYQCDGIEEDLETLKFLLNLCPNRRGYFAIDHLNLAWQRVEGYVEWSLKNNFHVHGKDPFCIEDRPSEYHPPFKILWDMFCLLCKSSYNPRLSGDQPALHALVGSRSYNECMCPPEALQFAMKIKPSELEEQDEDGNLPLHVIATWANPLRYYPYRGTQVDQMRLIASAAPNAARVPNHKGMLPLHIALKAGGQWDTGLRSLSRCDKFPR